MTMTDPIADMLTRIRNAIMAGHEHVTMPDSRMKRRVAEVLQREGYIEQFEVRTEQVSKPQLDIQLRRVGNNFAIRGLKRLSKPGQRKYARSTEIVNDVEGLGIVVLSTSKGLMTGHDAQQQNVGGELICAVW